MNSWRIDGTEDYPEWAQGRVFYERAYPPNAGILFNRGISRKVLMFRSKNRTKVYAEIGELLCIDDKKNLFVVGNEKEKV